MSKFVISDAVRAYWYISQCLKGRGECTTEYAIRELNVYLPRMNPERRLRPKMQHLMDSIVQGKPGLRSNHAHFHEGGISLKNVVAFTPRSRTDEL